MISEFPRVGKKCWVQRCAGYELPVGLADRSQVTVIDWEGFSGRCRDERGTVWDLVRTQIEPGLYLYLDGQKCGESHPKFAEYLRAGLAANLVRLEAGGQQSAAFERMLRESISCTRWYLARNGFDPDQPPAGPCPQITAPGRIVSTSPHLPVPANGEPRRMRS